MLQRFQKNQPEVGADGLRIAVGPVEVFLRHRQMGMKLLSHFLLAIKGNECRLALVLALILGVVERVVLQIVVELKGLPQLRGKPLQL